MGANISMDAFSIVLDVQTNSTQQVLDKKTADKTRSSYSIQLYYALANAQLKKTRKCFILIYMKQYTFQLLNYYLFHEVKVS